MINLNTVSNLCA